MEACRLAVLAVVACTVSAFAQPAPASVPTPLAPAVDASGPRAAKPVPEDSAFSTPTPSPDAPLDEPTPLPPDAPLITAVELNLPVGEERAGLEEFLELRVGERLSRRAARRTLENLLSTKRFSDVVVRAFPEPTGGVRVEISLLAQPKIISLGVEGNRVLSREEMLDAARLKLGQDYFPELLSSAVNNLEAAYRQRGYDDVHVTAEPFAREAEVAIDLRVDEGLPTRLGVLSIAGSPGLPLPRIQEALGISLGTVLDRRELEAGLDRLRGLYRRERFYAARVGEPVVFPGPSGARLALPISAGPRFTFHTHGNHRFSDTTLRGALRYDGTETLDESTINRLARRLESFYRYHGFPEVRVAPQQILRPDEAEAVLAFVVEEGPLVQVERIEMTGNQILSTQELLRLVVVGIANREPEEHGDVRNQEDPLQTEGRPTSPRESVPDEPEPPPGAVLIEEAYLEAAQAMESEYRQRGFIQARVRYLGAAVDASRHTAQVRFEINEGPRADVREVSFEGAPPSFDAAAMISGLTAGAPLSSGATEAARISLLRALGREGYLFARVDVLTETSRDGTRADVRFRIQAGSQVRLGHTVFQGLERTDEDVVRATLTLRPGALLDPQALVETQRSLLSLGLFRQVEVRLLEPERVEREKDVLILVKERARLLGEVSVGYFLTDGPRLSTDLTLSNLGGAGVNLTGRARANYVGASALSLRTGNLQGIEGVGLSVNAALQQPRIYALLPSAEVGARVDLVIERVIRQTASYRFDRVASIAGLDWSAFRWLTVQLQYELELDQVRLLSPTRGLTALLTALARADQDRLRFPFGIFALQTLRPSLAIDLRDDPVNPRSGLLLSAAAEVTRDIYTLSTDVDGTPRVDAAGQPQQLPIFSLKLSGNASAYVPLSERVILAFSLRGGRILPLDPDRANTIAPKRFYLGGSTTLRGFREDGVLPEETREQLDREVSACRQLANPAGCSAAAKVLATGVELPSEGGEFFAVAKSELRFPISSALDLGIFLEAGNLWLKPPAGLDQLNLRTVAGLGVRVGTPIGPLALDVGFNLARDALINESLANLNFSIGLF